MTQVVGSATWRGLDAAQALALGDAMAIATFTPDGELRSANANYLQLLGASAQQVLGRKHRSFCTEALRDSARYEQVWAQLRAGQGFCGVVERLRLDGTHCWLEANYIPVRNAQGQVDHILKVANDITERRAQAQQQQEHLQLLSLVADATDSAVLISDAQSRIVYVNGGFSRLMGWQLEEVQGQLAVSLLAPHIAPSVAQAYRAAFRIGESATREEVVVGKQGQRYWVKIVSNPITHPDGDWRYTVTVLTDITRAKMHETLQHAVLEAMARERPLTEVLHLMCEEVERIAPEVSASILEVDAQGLLHPLAAPSLPPSYTQLLDGLPIGPSTGSCGTAAWRNQSVRVNDIAHDPLWQDYKHLVLPLGYQACWSNPVRNSQGRVIGTFAFYYREPGMGVPQTLHQQLVDACTHLCALALEREHARNRIRQLAFYDSLTGLPNRSLLQAKADQAIGTADRNNEQLAVLFLDLDRFKQVNDSLGHPAGDELLRQAATRMSQTLRNVDITGRLSGDEFVVVLPQCNSEQVAATIDRLQTRLGEPLHIAETSLSVSASIGIAMFPNDGRDMETLLHHADMAMYQAKSNGRGGFSFFSNEMNRLAQERLALEVALRKALQAHELVLHYQPQVDLATGQLYGVEALARWHHAEWGEVSPSRFIPLAEECGLMGDLGRWALDTACQHLAAWRAQGLQVPAVSVNLSPSNFHNLDLPDMIMATLAQHALQPQDLTLELTESVLLDAHPSTMKTIDEVHARGIRLAMDDFGTGYSSLSYLRRLPVSELKLDRSFVSDLANDPTAQALSRAILGIGESLHLKVVAEGVENQAQEVILRNQGYPVAQGYLFARPMAAEALVQWLQRSAQGRREDGA